MIGRLRNYFDHLRQRVCFDVVETLKCFFAAPPRRFW
jgi:hypothetical protein